MIAKAKRKKMTERFWTPERKKHYYKLAAKEEHRREGEEMKKIKKIQQGKFFGKPVSIDTSKDLLDQPCIKSDLFSPMEKDVIKNAWAKSLVEFGPDKIITEIKDLGPK